ncbi:MAG TPA: hypothetical protein DIT99_26820 [Candidatus Latescibacteria bacterium]|nr:hypothetical protein [Candidatus Latescibacterota bacterium]
MVYDEVTPAGRVDDLLRPEVLNAFDRNTFEHDGFWAWEDILTDAGRRQWTASLQKVQQMNDEIIMDTDWAAIDFAGRGLQPPEPEKITQAFLTACCGGSEQMRFMSPGLREYMYDQGLFGPGSALVTRGFESQGMMPEYFPGAYDDFILDVTTAHPHMMHLFTRLLGDRFLLDHCLMLNRPPGSRGRHWHAHQYREGQYEVEDIIGTGHAVTTEFLQQQCIRTLCYPEGATAESGGQLGVIPGAHLYRIPYKWSTVRTDNDDDMKAGWLKRKTHPITGRPLEILRLSLPPGSMISFVHHMPHHVTPCLPDALTRWGLLMAYRTPDPKANPARWNKGVAAHWVERTEAAGKISLAAQRVFEADNPQTSEHHT